MSVRRAGARLIGTQRLDDNGALFLAAAAGYFKAEGIDRTMTTYECGRMVAEALASGTTDFALTGFCGLQLRRQGHDQGDRSANAGEAVLRGHRARRFQHRVQQGSADIRRYLGKTVAIEALGSISHCQLEQIARVKKVGMNRVTVKPMRTLDAIVHTIATEEIDAGIVPASYARDLLASNQAKLVGWYSELDEIQFGVLFASSKMIAIRQSRNSYVRTDAGSPTTRRRCCARTGIPSVPQTPSRTKRRQSLPGMFILIVEPAPRLQSRRAPIIDPQAQLDVADIDRQIAWHKAQGRSTRPSAHAMSLIEFRQVGIFPQRRISLASLPMS